ncbi:hypothetical protein FRX31_032583 [Thalictrum thalictroides]|uniref:Uncharacterized protein n=1 Tax=Thalictrum thalictroides TaxID=46969 RepID=A0A7J6UZG9_THATH|nr:hypothetical protein FRX31_032583 [Thalictrum thalictroides]
MIDNLMLGETIFADDRKSFDVEVFDEARNNLGFIGKNRNEDMTLVLEDNNYGCSVSLLFILRQIKTGQCRKRVVCLKVNALVNEILDEYTCGSVEEQQLGHGKSDVGVGRNDVQNQMWMVLSCNSERNVF